MEFRDACWVISIRQNFLAILTEFYRVSMYLTQILTIIYFENILERSKAKVEQKNFMKLTIVESDFEVLHQTKSISNLSF